MARLLNGNSTQTRIAITRKRVVRVGIAISIQKKHQFQDLKEVYYKCSLAAFFYYGGKMAPALKKRGPAAERPLS